MPPPSAEAPLGVPAPSPRRILPPAAQEVVDGRQHVVGSVGQGRQVEGDDIQAEQQILAERAYDAFGDEIARDARAQGAFSTGIGFAGAYRIGQTPLYQMGHRVYDAETAAFLTPDPLGGTTNEGLYAYAYANPHRFADPSGLSSFPHEGTDPDVDLDELPVLEMEGAHVEGGYSVWGWLTQELNKYHWSNSN